jgi:hypothetical protein
MPPNLPDAILRIGCMCSADQHWLQAPKGLDWPKNVFEMKGSCGRMRREATVELDHVILFVAGAEVAGRMFPGCALDPGADTTGRARATAESCSSAA